jgi:glutamate formiminotransferase/glutamate formiminotransferase/formiminotetrahydrofolate cyclodeaminase
VPTLLAVPNVSEGRDRALVQEIAGALAAGGAARLLDVHSDPDYHRSVFTLTAEQGLLADAVLAGARVAIERIDVMHGPLAHERGAHPHVGALDVAPIVYLDTSARGAACAEALTLAHAIGELGVPVLLYGELARGRARAGLRRGGVSALTARLQAGAMWPDFGPPGLHPTAGATLVAAREPLVAFNLELAAPATVKDARRIAALIREGGTQGLPGLRAIGVELRFASAEQAQAGGVGERGSKSARSTLAQVSTNVERPLEVPLAAVVAAVRKHAEIEHAELVGLAPRAALAGFPAEVAWRGGDPAARTIENALGL